MLSLFHVENYKKIFFVLLIISISPLLFSKINLIGNHEIPNYLNNFLSFRDFLLNHEEINFLIETNNQRYRPTFYIIKGLEYFLFKDNHFYYFLFKFLFIILIGYLIYRLNNILFKKKDLVFFSTSALIFFPTNYDIFSRLDVQEFYFLIFFSILLYIIVRTNNEKFNKIDDSDFLKLILLVLIIGIKEIFIFHIFIFFIFNYFFKLEITLFKNKFYYFLLFLFQLLFLIKFLIIFSNVGSDSYELEHNFDKLIYLIKIFPIQNPINLMLIFSWIFCIFLIYKAKINKYDLKIFLLLTTHIIFDYLFYQGLGSYRHYIIGLICIVYFLSILYEKYLFNVIFFKNNTSLMKNFSFIIILVLFTMLFSLNLKMTIQNIQEQKILSKVYNSNTDLVIKSLSPDERIISVSYFANFYKPQKKIIYNDGKKSSLLLQENLKFRFLMSKNNYIISDNEYDCLIFEKNLKTDECKNLYFFPKEIDLF